MTKKRRKWYRAIAVVLIAILFISTNANAALAAGSSMPNEVYNTDGITVEVTKLNATESIIDFEDSNGGEEYVIYSHGEGTGNY